MPDISERNFESTIECALLAGGPDACPGDETPLREPPPTYGAPSSGGLVPGGYLRRTSQDYDPELCLDPDMVVAFVQATQPKEWAKLKKHYRDQARPRFLRRLSGEIGKRGTLTSGQGNPNRKAISLSKRFWLSLRFSSPICDYSLTLRCCLSNGFLEN